jgi:hypothetical protein
VLGDGGAGKTAFLKVVARSMMITGQPENMSYAVITPRPEEWGGWDGQPNCLGIWHSQASRVGDLFFDLAAWAENPQKTGNTVLLIDDLGSLAYLNRHDLECLYWLFRYGPAGHVRALVTLNSEYSRDLPNWLNMFRTRVFGHISDPLLEEELTPIPESRLHKLLPGAQFCIKEGQEWLRFWLPLVVDETNRRFV